MSSCKIVKHVCLFIEIKAWNSFDLITHCNFSSFLSVYCYELNILICIFFSKSMKFWLELDTWGAIRSPEVYDDSRTLSNDVLKLIEISYINDRIHLSITLSLSLRSLRSSWHLWSRLVKHWVSTLKSLLRLFKHGSYHLTNWCLNKLLRLFKNWMRYILSKQEIANFIGEMITVPCDDIICSKCKSFFDVI